MDALTAYNQTADTLNSSDECPCKVFPLLGNDTTVVDVTAAALAAANDILTKSNGDVTSGEFFNGMGHLVTILLQVGYVMGADNAFDVTAGEIVIPDTLAGYDFLENIERGEN